MAKAKTTRKKRNHKRKTGEEGAILEDQVEQSDPSEVTTVDETPEISTDPEGAQTMEPVQTVESGGNGDVAPSVEVAEELTDEESTHAKYERIKKGNLYLTDLQ